MEITIKTNENKLQVGTFDSDKEIEFCILDNDGNTLGLLFLSPNKINELISHLVNELSDIKEPIDALKP